MASLKDEMSASEKCDPLLLIPGHRLSRMIKEGGVYIDRIKQVQPRINCMAEARFEAALEEARAIDDLVRRFRELPTSGASGYDSHEQEFSESELQRLRSPLLGVPVSIKESIMVSGMLNTCGSWSRRQERARSDALVVARLKHFGLVPICTSNIPEMTLFWADCQNPVYGRARNPYNKKRITGASSGGEAGLISAAGSLMGVGSDIGGSLRSPAHYCGIFSHKPTPYLVSVDGNYPPIKEARRRLFTMGPLCRYASDLRHLLRLLLSETSNERTADKEQAGISIHQPVDIDMQRQHLLNLLDDSSGSEKDSPASAAIDFSKVKLFYCNYSKVNRLMALVGQRELRVQTEICAAQREVLDHFVGKFNCSAEEIDLDGYLKDMFNMWQAMVVCGAVPNDQQAFEKDEIAHMFGIKNVSWEILKWFVGASRHTKEALLTLVFGLPVPKQRQRAQAFCEKYERQAASIKTELESKLGQNGVLVMPTLPTVAHRHNYALLRTNEARFPFLLNCMQLPATHATVRLSQKHKLPYGLTFASRPYNDHLTIAMAEEVEAAFGGWTLPMNLVPAVKVPANITIDKMNQARLVSGKEISAANRSKNVESSLQIET